MRLVWAGDHSVSLIHRWSRAVGGELGSLNGGIATDHHGHRPGENAHQCEQHGAPVPVNTLKEPNGVAVGSLLLVCAAEELDTSESKT